MSTDENEIECIDCPHTTFPKFLSDEGRCYVCESRHRKRQQADAETATASDGGAVEADADADEDQAADDKANITISNMDQARLQQQRTRARARTENNYRIASCPSSSGPSSSISSGKSRAAASAITDRTQAWYCSGFFAPSRSSFRSRKLRAPNASTGSTPARRKPSSMAMPPFTKNLRRIDRLKLECRRGSSIALITRGSLKGTPQDVQPAPVMGLLKQYRPSDIGVMVYGGTQ